MCQYLNSWRGVPNSIPTTVIRSTALLKGLCVVIPGQFRNLKLNTIYYIRKFHSTQFITSEKCKQTFHSTQFISSEKCKQNKTAMWYAAIHETKLESPVKSWHV